MKLIIPHLCLSTYQMCSQCLQSLSRTLVWLYNQFVSQLYSIWDMNSNVKLNKVTEAWNIGQSDLFLNIADLLPKAHLHARLEEPKPSRLRDTNFDLNLNVSHWSMKWRSVTYFWLDADLLLKAHLHARLEEPTLSRLRDTNFDLNLNVSQWSMKCRSKWPTFDWMLTYKQRCICMQD